MSKSLLSKTETKCLVDKTPLSRFPYSIQKYSPVKSGPTKVPMDMYRGPERKFIPDHEPAKIQKYSPVKSGPTKIPIDLSKENFYIVHDAIQGRREIAPGTGEVQVCVGFMYELDPITGKRKEVPVFRTDTF